MSYTQIRISIINNIIKSCPLLEKGRTTILRLCFKHFDNKIFQAITVQLLNVEELQDLSRYWKRLYLRRSIRESNDRNSTFFK